MSSAQLSLPEALVVKYDQPVPRYTSYPPANHFTTPFSPHHYARWLGEVTPGTPLSVYVHLPFCTSICWYCGCTMKVSNQPAPMARYMEDLSREIALVSQYLPHRLPLKHLHLGGGTPTHIAPPHLQRMMQQLRTVFNVTTEAECAIEIDPRTLTQEKAEILAAEGFNRASLGVQDTNLAVQKAIHRIQPLEQVQQCIQWLRNAGIHSINLDLIYGLPHQTDDTIRQTVADALSLTPQRIALFGYAHVPQIKKHQKLLERTPLPSTSARHHLLTVAATALIQAGYQPIGIDHFVQPTDSLATADRQGTLRRNFQGYTPDDCNLLLGLGVSAISQLPQGYAQNTTSLKDYATSLALKLLPIVRGHTLTPDDTERRTHIMTLMCHYKVTLPQPLLIEALPRLQPLLIDGLITLEGSLLRVTPRGRPLVRIIAACFDLYSQASIKPHARAI